MTFITGALGVRRSSRSAQARQRDLRPAGMEAADFADLKAARRGAAANEGRRCQQHDACERPFHLLLLVSRRRAVKFARPNLLLSYCYYNINLSQGAKHMPYAVSFNSTGHDPFPTRAQRHARPVLQGDFAAQATLPRTEGGNFAGRFGDTGALPKEEALCERFGVSRITVRRALADLAALGLVERRHGRGTFVRQDRVPVARPNPSLGLIDSLRQTASGTDVQVLLVERAEAPADVAAMLQLAAGEKAVHALRLRSVSGIPVMLSDAWVPAQLGKQVTMASLRKHALYEILLAQGVKFGRVIQEISADISAPHAKPAAADRSGRAAAKGSARDPRP
ncbi:GntR family transcriptional regulator [Variovorax sp. UC122_21]|uniref:GntR family transcriptional regulator n=1 Tax=Variovorax sp. UC122_21 TaxID=3374554 RepID=UPI00375751AF